MGDDVNEPGDLFIGYCQTETATVTTTPGEATSPTTGLVYAAGITPGAGQGQDIIAELVWGAPDLSPELWPNNVPATYREDVDGLFDGDLANDRYEAVITPDIEGSYAYAFRFRLGEEDWLYCGTSGTDHDAGLPAADDLGTLDVVEAIIERPDACQVQFPQLIADAVTNEPLTIFGRVTKAGLTDVSDADPSISAQLLIGPPDASPLTNLASFSTLDASHNDSVTGQTYDEYEAQFTPSTAGTYSLYYAFSLDGGEHWSYCDLHPRQGTFDVEVGQGAALVVFDEAPNLISYCRVWQQNLTATTADAPPTITVEIYEAGLTDDQLGDNADALDVQVGHGPRGANPALGDAYVWNPDALPFARLGPGNSNNYEYEGGVYPTDAIPAAGEYALAIRVRKTGEAAWVYCDTDETTMSFNVLRTTNLEITDP